MQPLYHMEGPLLNDIPRNQKHKLVRAYWNTRCECVVSETLMKYTCRRGSHFMRRDGVAST